MTDLMEKTATVKAPELGLAVGDDAFIIYEAFTPDEYVKKTTVIAIENLFGQVNIQVDGYQRPFARVITEDASTHNYYQKFIAPHKGTQTVYLCAAVEEMRNRWITQETRKRLMTIVERLSPPAHRPATPYRTAARPKDVVRDLENLLNFVKSEAGLND